MSSVLDKPSKWPEGYRPCTSCLNMLPFDKFHAHKECMFGVNTVCKKCRAVLSKRQWSEKTPEYKIWTRAKSRAKKKGIPFNIEQSDILIPQLCPVLGIKLVEGDVDAAPSIDKLVPRLGYVKGNIRIISNRANMLKNNATVDELEKILLDARRVCEVVDIGQKDE